MGLPLSESQPQSSSSQMFIPPVLGGSTPATRPATLQVDRTTAPTRDTDPQTKSLPMGSYIAIIGTKTSETKRASSVGAEVTMSHIKPENSARASSVGMEFTVKSKLDEGGSQKVGQLWPTASGGNTTGRFISRSLSPEPRSERSSHIPVNKLSWRSLSPDPGTQVRTGSPSPDTQHTPGGARTQSHIPGTGINTRGAMGSNNSQSQGASSISNKNADQPVHIGSPYPHKDLLVKDFGPPQVINPTRGLRKFASNPAHDEPKGRKES